MKRPALLFICLAGFAFFFQVSAQLQAVQLQCEYRDNPPGIDETQPRLSWILDSGGKSKSQTAYRILAASSAENLSLDTGDLWDSGMVPGSNPTNIIYRGKPLVSFQECYWKVRVWDEQERESAWSDPAFFSIGPLTPTDWNADWISSAKDEDPRNFPWLRKTIHLQELPHKAYAHINMYGYFELYINGEKVGDDILSPSVSDYSKQSLYVTLDITPYLREGQNVMGLWIAHGWYRKDEIGYYGVTEDRPVARALFEFREMDGKSDFHATDRTWKYHLSNRSYSGSWRWGHFGGERVLPGKMIPGWSMPEMDDSDWKQVDNYKLPSVPVVAQRNNPTRIMDTLSVKEIIQLGENEFLVDFGKHLNGWIDFQYNGENTDSQIVIDYIDKLLARGEEWDPLENSFAVKLLGDTLERSIITYNQRDIIHPDTISDGHFRNKFNYHGFRWILVSGVNEIKGHDLKALMISEDILQITGFESSNPLLNRIWEIVNHTYRCNTYSGYVVDCPHRERVGYGGDSHSSMETALSNFDMAALYNKWTIGWNLGNYPTGLWPHTIPEIPQHKNKFSPGWGGFGMFMPWQFYVYYGDTVNLSRAWPYMLRWMNYLQSNTKDGILYPDKARGDTHGWSFHGDWVAPYYGMQPERRVDQRSTYLFNNCYYLYSLQMAIRIAGVLGRQEEAQNFRNLLEYSLVKIHTAFFNPETGDYANGEQPYQAFPLYVGLLKGQMKEDLDRKLEFLILEKNSGHLNTGMLGTYFMFEYLMESGRNDLIYTMVNQKTFPGWGYMIEQGATTIWEQWNGQNSQIHNCYLSVGKWFVQGLGGIRPDEENPGFSHFYIVPGIVEELDYAKVSYNSRRGEIVSNWEKYGDMITLEVRVPVSTTATLVLPPEAGQKKVIMNGKNVRDLFPCERYNGKAIKLEAGSYFIELK
ncbi:MAG: family 78 glycoside hydrolase catalytic domain [Bacteroidales bacterium]|nr:family 78 glycoside hydrolase catalytic domain [Bacteroidales bacterium]